MEKIILETIQQGIHQYHKIESFPVTVGRAFDNDIILQDATISPHHLLISKEEDTILIQNLTAEENGTKLNGVPLNTTAVEAKLPANILMSDIKARLLSSEMAVEKTYVENCSGFFCFYSNPIWGVLLLIATIVILFLEKYFVTPVTKEPLFYLSSVLPTIWMMLSIAVIITVISQVRTYRWEVASAMSIAAFIILLPQLFHYLGHYVSYFFTEDSLAIWFKYSAKFFIVPVLLSIFIVKTIHTKWLPAIGVSTLLYSPFIAFQLLGAVDELMTKSGFSEVPSYSQTLLPGDSRLNTTISLDQFIKEANKETKNQVQEMLDEAKKKEAEES